MPSNDQPSSSGLQPPASGLSLGQICIGVAELERAVGFYRDVLGLRMLFQVPNMAFFDCGGVRLMLALPEQGGKKPDCSVLYFKVGDIEAAHGQLVQRGVAFRGQPHLVAKMPDHELWMAFFDDSEGNLHALMCERGRD